MKIPEITIKITPAPTVPMISVSATWISQDGTLRTTNHAITLMALDEFLGDLVYEILDEIRTVEEDYGPKKEK